MTIFEMVDELENKWDDIVDTTAKESERPKAKRIKLGAERVVTADDPSEKSARLHAGKWLEGRARER